MKLGIVGPARAGKTTLFSALTGRLFDESSGSTRINTVQGVVSVPDERFEWLTKLYNPRKQTPATVTYIDFQGFQADPKDRKDYIALLLNHIRPLDALLMVLRNFPDPFLGNPKPIEDYKNLEEEFILSDLATVEKRIERIEHEEKKGRKPLGREKELLFECSRILNREEPLRLYPLLAAAPELRGFTFLSAKPLMVVINCSDDDEEISPVNLGRIEAIPVRARLEMEIVQLPPHEIETYKQSFGVKTLARDLIIRKSYEILNLITFFTVGEDEVRAWTISKGTIALKAAGTIHSDMEKGFIRAEVVSYGDLHRLGDYGKARKEGLVRLEGKDYIVSDGDIMHIRFGLTSTSKKP